MAKTRVVLHYAGFRALRTSSPVKDLVLAEAEKVAARAGRGFGVARIAAPRNRWRALVAAQTRSAMYRNARDNTLVRAVGGSA